MNVSESLSLYPYFQVRTETGLSFGGSQTWFPAKSGFRERMLHMGGCGLVSACDFILYGRSGHKPVDKERYMTFLRKMSRFRYPVFPKFGSLSFQQPIFINQYFRSEGRKERLHFLFLNTKKKRLAVIRDSLRNNHPVILVIGARVLQPFSKKGVNFYKLYEGKLTLSAKDVSRHFVTVTGILCPADISEPLYLEISSWGQRFYVNYDELSEYIAHYSLPLISSIYYVK